MSEHPNNTSEKPTQTAIFELRLVAFDKPTTRRHWNGGAFPSPEAHDALNRAVEAFRESVRGDGFTIVRTGYGVIAEDRS